METSLKARLADKGTWTRFVYMVLFAVIFGVAEIVAWVVVCVQFLFKLFTGAVNEPLRDFGYRLAVYFREMVAFLTYHTEEKPYPFAPWPAAAPERGPAEESLPEAAPEPEAKPETPPEERPEG
jgi:hypothetical protein